jgi:excisionase family DNA binding protein
VTCVTSKMCSLVSKQDENVYNNFEQKNAQKLFDNYIGDNEWLTTEKAARILSISSNALRIMVHRNQIEVYKFGRRLRFKVSDCLALIKKKGADNGH